MTAEFTVLPLDGEITIYRAAEIRLGLLAALSDSPEGLEIDMAEVVEIDSAGIQLLMAVRRDAQSEGVPLRITHCSEPVKELIALFDVSSFFAETLEPAAAAEGESA